MENQRTHPLIISAAVAVILFCGVGVASMTGLLGKSEAKDPPPEVAMQATAEGSTPGNTAQPVTNAPAVQAPAAPAVAPPVHHSRPVAKSAPAVAYNAPPPVQTAAVCDSCGEVVAINERKVQGDGSGVGAVAGGVTGAVVGKQFGKGDGSTAMAVLGAVGGAMLGNKIEKDYKAATVYEVVVELNNGTTRTFKYKERPTWQRGDQVKVVDGSLRARG